MTFRGLQYQFECDSCERLIEIQGNPDLENITSIQALADHEFDEYASHRLSPWLRVSAGHICVACAELSDMYFNGSQSTVAEIKATIERVKREAEDVEKD